MLPTDLSLARARYHVLDVREQGEWDAGHLDGAQHIPLGQLAARLAELPLDKIVVCICKVGGRSEAARAGLVRMGIEAENLEGGMVAWHRAGLELVSSVGGAPGRVI
ncbi:MAG: rhodanese-like domain-containing protein [Chloroflexi bacterium]|nr:rhodanese-like domain-containing protein [Chloroflexota bacterium]